MRELTGTVEAAHGNGQPGLFSGTMSVHVCDLQEAGGDHMPTAVQFVLAGLDANEKCLYIGDRSSRDDVFEAVLKTGAVDEVSLTRQFTYLPSGDAYLRDGRFEVQRMLGLLDEVERRAIAEGFKGMRGVGEMTWACSGAPGTEKLAEYEARLNYMYPQSPSSLLCVYEEGDFAPSTLIDVVKAHPRVVIRGTLCRNPYYVPPDEFLPSLKGEVPRAVYERAAKDIFRRARCAEMQMLELQDLRRANRQLSLLNDVAFTDIKNELSIMAFLSEIALECCPGGKAREYIEEVTGRCQVAQRQLDFIRACQSITVSGVGWHSLGQAFASASSSAGAVFRFHGGEFYVFANNNLETALVALLETASRLASKGAEVRIEPGEGTEGLRVVVSARGRGVPEDLKERLFERGFRYDGCDGYELFLAREILHATGITVRETGVPGKEVRFEIRVPKSRYKRA